jgi:TPP-dependent pyruvate/acetoin dehydrogenase alpha subunit
MLLARILDEKFASLYRAGKIHGGVFIGRGQEALSVSIGMQLRKADIFAPLIRDQAGRLAFGETPADAARNYLGSALGPMRGRDGNVHRGRPKQGYLPMISHLGSTIAVVNGALFAKRMKGESGFVGAASVGDGATSTGAFHEALNQAAVERLPLVLVVANNQFAYSTPTSRQFACESISEKARGYGVQAHRVAGNDLVECLNVCGRAIGAARGGGGPQLVEADLLRLCGHGEHDDAGYISQELKDSPLGRDCLKLAEEALVSAGMVDRAEIMRWRADSIREVDEVVARVQREPVPDPFQEDWCALASRHLQETHSHPEE